jgi:DNA-binding response OmpR family regulator
MHAVTDLPDGAPRVNILVGHEIEETESINSLLRRGVIVILAGSTERLASWMARTEDRSIEPWLGPITDEPIAKHSASIGHLAVDQQQRIVRWRGRKVPLSQREFLILLCLATEPGAARSFHELTQSAWGEQGPDSRYRCPIHSAIKRLRSKLLDEGVSVRIESVPSYGFRLTTD